MTDKPLKRFQLPMVVKDTGKFHSRYNDFVKLLIEMMRNQGYVPVYDISPHVATTYNAKKKNFDVVLTMQGAYLGRKRAWEVDGITAGKELPMPTRPTKSKQ